MRWKGDGIMADKKITIESMNITYEPDVIKKIIAKAIGKVDGVLALSGGGFFSSMKGAFSSKTEPFDFHQGIEITKDGDLLYINIKIITEYGKNVPAIVDEIREKVNKDVKDMTGIEFAGINVEIEDSLSKEECGEEKPLEEVVDEEIDEEI